MIPFSKAESTHLTVRTASPTKIIPTTSPLHRCPLAPPARPTPASRPCPPSRTTPGASTKTRLVAAAVPPAAVASAAVGDAASATPRAAASPAPRAVASAATAHVASATAAAPYAPSARYVCSCLALPGHQDADDLLRQARH